MGWIADKLLGLRRVFDDAGSQLPERGALEFTGDGVEVEDDSINKRTKITIAGGGSITNVTAGSNISVTTPETGVRQVALSATPSVTSVTAASHVDFGGATRRIQVAAPANLGEHQIGTDGWMWGYHDEEGVPAAYLRALDMPFRERFVQEYTDEDPLDGLNDFCIAESMPFETVILGSLKIVFADPITANDTDYAQFRLFIRRDSDGEFISDIATFSTKATGTGAMGNVSRGIPKSRTPSPSVVPANHSLWFEVIKNAAGVTLPPYHFSFQRIRSSLVNFG